jgi:hypothetical protein
MTSKSTNQELGIDINDFYNECEDHKNNSKPKNM